MVQTTRLLLLVGVIVSTCIVFYATYGREGFLDVLFINDKKTVEIVQRNNIYDRSLINFIAKTDGKYRMVDAAPSGLYLDNIGMMPRDVGREIVAVTDDKCSACFIKGFFSSVSGSMLEDLQGFRVGYVHDSHLHLALTILTCCNIQTHIRFVKIDKRDCENELTRPLHTDAIFYFGSPEDPSLVGVHGAKLVVLSMRNFDKEIANMILPNAIIDDVHVQSMFNNVVTIESPIQTIVRFHNVLYAKPGHKMNHLEVLLVGYFARNTRELMRLAPNAQAIELVAPPIETFLDAATMVMTLIPNENIPGYFDSTTNTFEYPSDTMDGVPLHQGDIVILKHQTSNTERGEYIVRGIRNGTTLLALQHLHRQRRDKSKDDTFFCVTNPSIKLEKECIANMGIWDAPCAISQECPFFQKNTTHRNYRGGCNDGYCELPLGTKRIGFKHFSGKPLCHGCPSEDLACCDSQHPPDYAFGSSS